MLKIHIITVFPDSFKSYINSSILKNAQKKWIFEPIFYDLGDFSIKKTRRVDDRPYGWFPWAILSIEPLYKAIKSIEEKHPGIRKIYLSPKWKTLKQHKLEKLAKNKKDIILICGHYEWIDSRILEMFEIEEISIWDYILTSWELAAMVLIDWIVRLLPWVINEKSLEEESFSKKLWRKKEYPWYTRPEEFMWFKVPKELLSWDPKIIEKWKNNFNK
ncbi:MAG: tRNA (guanine-N(1)-)-methyltransferase [uncultured bacterium (gcode 4)]|uniref:tRNA (guanine-N(1)-)-methyltransferase n=1 Tax=uncultured bacterium (gcode 4) TaxID=1234023 RepID=K2G7D6_9BACT|nr:MAG: tRNA (guanine-N(1)-)-methyltransferase [uncultured bacterium (gcode 4)]